MIELQDLSFAYTRRGALLKEISLQIPPGSFTAIVGPNGCGKSTLLKLCGGLLQPRKGRVCLQGRDIRTIPHRQRARTVAILLQNMPLSHLTVEQIALAGRSPYRKPGCGYTKADREIAAQSMVQAGCRHLWDREYPSLSGGERQRALLAMVLAQETEVLLLDEPTTALDIHAALELMELVSHLQRAGGKTVVMVLHDLDLALRYAHRLVVMDDGCVVGEGDPQAVLSSGMLEGAFQVRVEAFQLEGQAFHGFYSLKS